MFSFVNQPMRLKYYHPGAYNIIDAGPIQFEENWYDAWLDTMVKMGEGTIFFIVVETTDVFEPEMDFNTVVMGAGNDQIIHSYSPKCPEGCRGQMEGCHYHPDKTHIHINDGTDEIAMPEPLNAYEHTMTTGHETEMKFGDPGWRCKACSVRAPGWELEKSKIEDRIAPAARRPLFQGSHRDSLFLDPETLKLPGE